MLTTKTSLWFLQKVSIVFHYSAVFFSLQSIKQWLNSSWKFIIIFHFLKSMGNHSNLHFLFFIVIQSNTTHEFSLKKTFKREITKYPYKKFLSIKNHYFSVIYFIIIMFLKIPIWNSNIVFYKFITANYKQKWLPPFLCSMIIGFRNKTEQKYLNIPSI